MRDTQQSESMKVTRILKEKDKGDRLEVWDVSKRGSMESLGNIGRKGEKIITKTRSSLNNNESMKSNDGAAGDISIIE